MRRTALRRVTPLRTTKLAGKRPRDTGPDAQTRALVKERSGGRCELCAGPEATHVHHRKLRRHNDHTIMNLLHLCPECHAEAHANPERSYVTGALVRGFSDPASRPVLTYFGWVRLTADGTKVPA